MSVQVVRGRLLEVVHLPAARAERLDRAWKRIARQGGVVVLVDGALIPTRRPHPRPVPAPAAPAAPPFRAGAGRTVCSCSS
ncbi:hypothetical protein [Streptomyces sp. NBC_01615]|uniref:hypothetical protein n=1 Tax=Streptomyces sp. NBC_01615 TaxID=2975898 RepID=UPI00386D26EC